MTDEGTRYYYCEKCKKAIDPSDLVFKPGEGMPGAHATHWFQRQTCGPVVVR